MSNPIICLSRQNENTWASFHPRLSGITLNYEDMFSDAVVKLLEAKAKSIRSSVGYLLPLLITTTSFLLANTYAHFLNIYTMSVGHPGTRKSSEPPNYPLIYLPRFSSTKTIAEPVSCRATLLYIYHIVKAL